MAKKTAADLQINIGANTRQLVEEMKKVNAKMSGFKKKIGGIGKALGPLGAAIGGAFAVSKVIEFGKEVRELAGVAQGVQAAFDNLNRPDLLANLQKATAGTVSKLELMKQTVTAKSLRVPVEKLATFFQFAAKRAQETGQSVDYLTDSIVKGIGRKSPLILDNLGISAVELKEEFKKVGDFGLAVANIIEREIGKQGPILETAAIKSARWRAQLENIKVVIGTYLNKAIEKLGPTIDKVMTFAVNAFKNIGPFIRNIANFFIELYNNSLLFRMQIQYAIFFFKALWETVKFVFARIVEGFKTIGKLIKAVFTADFKAIPGIYADYIKEAFGDVKELGKNIAKDAKEGIEKAFKAEKIELLKGDTEEDIKKQALSTGIEAGKTLAKGIKLGMSSSRESSPGQIKGKDAGLLPTSEPGTGLANMNMEGRMKELKNQVAPLIEVTNMIKNNIGSLLSEMGTMFGDFIVKIAQGTATGTDMLKAFGKTVLMAFANFAKQFGEYMIATGLASEAFKIVGASGIPAIAAGIALVTLAGVTQSLLNSSSAGISGAGGASNQAKPRANIISQGQQKQEVRFVIEGQDLVSVINNENKRTTLGS